MALKLKFPVFFKNEDVVFLRDALMLVTAELNNLRVDHQAMKVTSIERYGALTHTIRIMSESLETDKNSPKSPEIDEIGRKVDALALKVEHLTVIVHDYAKAEAERAETNENETVLRLGGLE